MSQPPTSTPPGPKPYRAPVELFGSRGLIDSQGRTVKFSLPPPIRFGECRMTKGEVKELKALLRLPPDPPDVQPGTGQRASVKPSVRPNLRDITDDVVNARWFKRLVIHYLQVTMVTATAWRPDELAPKPEEDVSADMMEAEAHGSALQLPQPQDNNRPFRCLTRPRNQSFRRELLRRKNTHSSYRLATIPKMRVTQLCQ